MHVKCKITKTHKKTSRFKNMFTPNLGKNAVLYVRKIL